MQYDLSKSDRFFLNQLIPKWHSGQPFDLYGDMKYIFHREMGTNYNTTHFEQTVEHLRAFLSDHGFARESRKHIFNLLPKGNMLMVKGTIELFEQYQERERIEGKAIVIPPTNSDILRAQPPEFIAIRDNRSAIPFFLRLLMVLGAIILAGMLILYLMNRNE